MKLWYLRPKGAGWAPFTSDAVAFLVRAETEADARAFLSVLRMPAVTARDNRWLDTAQAACVEISNVDRKGALTELTGRPDAREIP
jgi:hypothetical protein